ncbi:MAG: AmmeMemoRadiSam system radical SAM enzyme [Desulfurococcales archaeon]|nr:AmmeMemoRadiSam system radical SAM enzyme [Desulfurococcales archaeon]
MASPTTSEKDRLLTRPYVRPAILWEPVESRKGWVKCNLCERRCLIAPGRYGACGVRKNIGGKLYTLVYGLLTAMNVDPIEKKPLFHFYPGAEVLSISTVGCNFFCQFCQNWVISQSRLEKGLYGEYHPPEDVVRAALEAGADGIAYTYNEPTIFLEYILDVAKLAKKYDLINMMVTNGYATPEAVDEMAPYMDAATVDFKGGGNKEFYKRYIGVLDPDKIFNTILAMKEKGMWIEITNLVVPKVGDKEEDIRRLAKWIVENLGPETPFHLLRFYPHYRMTHLPPTPVETLERLAEVAREEGLVHVYIGNVPGHPLEHTYCPRCGYKVIERYSVWITRYNLSEDNRCPKCGYKLNIRGTFKGRRRFLII